MKKRLSLVAICAVICILCFVIEYSVTGQKNLSTFLSALFLIVLVMQLSGDADDGDDDWDDEDEYDDDFEDDD